MPRKILFVHDSGRLGGAAKVLFHLISTLDRSEFSSHVVCGSNGPFVDAVSGIGIPVHVVEFFRPYRLGNRVGFWIPSPTALYLNLRELFRSCRCLRKFLRKTEFDILHANGLVANLVSGISHIGDRRPMIWHEHGIQPPGFRRLLYSACANLFPHRMIAVSDAVADVYRPFLYSATKMRTVHNGLSFHVLQSPLPNAPAESLRDQLGLDRDAQIVVIPSLMVPWKGHDVFLRAASIIHKQDASTFFLLLGDVNSDLGRAFKSQLLALTSELGLTDCVRFLGFRPDISRILEESNVVVSASILPDPFPTIILEAMHHSKPVVATRTGGQPEMVAHNETGLLVEPAQPNALAEAISSLLSDPQKAKRMGIAGRLRVNARFTNALFVQRITDLYRELLG